MPSEPSLARSEVVVIQQPLQAGYFPACLLSLQQTAASIRDQFAGVAMGSTLEPKCDALWDSDSSIFGGHPLCPISGLARFVGLTPLTAHAHVAVRRRCPPTIQRATYPNLQTAK